MTSVSEAILAGDAAVPSSSTAGRETVEQAASGTVTASSAPKARHRLTLDRPRLIECPVLARAEASSAAGFCSTAECGDVATVVARRSAAAATAGATTAGRHRARLAGDEAFALGA